jgi:hypothetical protein
MSERRSTLSSKFSSIPDNIVFVGCCNPFRINVVKKGKQEDEEVGLEVEKRVSKLSHKVYPINYSLINYVYDFGQLSPEAEIKYIEAIIKYTVEKNTESRFLKCKPI